MPSGIALSTFVHATGDGRLDKTGGTISGIDEVNLDDRNTAVAADPDTGRYDHAVYVYDTTPGTRLTRDSTAGDGVVLNSTDTANSSGYWND